MVTPTVAQVGDAYLVASGILTPDEEGFNAVDESHNPERGAHRVLAFAQDMLRVSRLVRWVPTRLLPAPHHLHHARLAGLRRTVHVCVCVCVCSCVPSLRVVCSRVAVVHMYAASRAGVRPTCFAQALSALVHPTSGQGYPLPCKQAGAMTV